MFLCMVEAKQSKAKVMIKPDIDYIKILKNETDIDAYQKETLCFCNYRYDPGFSNGKYY